jgi:hypothetical protein
MRPIRLHLDTSDYAAMYRAPPATPAAQVRDELLKMTGSGRIEIALSYHVVFELLQKAEPRFREDRLSRARLIEQFCGKNALPYPTDLGQGYGFSHDGLWVPRIDLEEIEIERLVQHVIQTIAKRPDLNSHERKALSKRKFFIEWLRNNPSKAKWLLEDHWPLPFGRSFAEGGDFRRYILGEISQEDVNKDLRLYITDPVTVYELWFETYSRDNPVPQRRDLIADKLVVMFRELREKLDEAADIKSELKKAIATTGENAPSAKQRDAFKTLGREVDAFCSEINSPEAFSKHPVWVATFGEEAAQIAAEVFYALYGQMDSQKRDIKPSNAIDLIHAMYLPHVDLWRGDKDFSNVLIKNRVKFYERVVPTLSELLGRIEIETAKF